MFELKTVMFKVLCSRETILSGETVLQMDILIGTMCYTDWEKKKKKEPKSIQDSKGFIVNWLYVQVIQSNWDTVNSLTKRV